MMIDQVLWCCYLFFYIGFMYLCVYFISYQLCVTSVNLGGAHGICHPRDMANVVHGIYPTGVNTYVLWAYPVDNIFSCGVYPVNEKYDVVHGI